MGRSRASERAHGRAGAPLLDQRALAVPILAACWPMVEWMARPPAGAPRSGMEGKEKPGKTGRVALG
eukprot:scaffold12210_cov124-Isochrysis_galbana.AAC.2